MTIVTTTPNAVLAEIHHRMPVVVDEPHWSIWLEQDSPAPELHRLLQPFAPERTVATPVSTFVNAPANDDERCIQAVDTL